MAPPPISPAYLASDALFEQEVLKLSAAESEDDLNRRLVQSAEDVGMSEHEIAQCLGPHFMPMALHTAPSSVSTAIHSPNSRGSFNTGSTAPTSSHSILSDEPRPSMHGAAHRKNISISSLFGARGGRDMPQPSLDSIPVTLPEVPNSSLKAKAQFLVRDVEINILNGKGLRKFSKGFSVFRKGSGNEPVPWQPEPSPHDPVKYSTGGIHAGLAGRIELKDQHRPMIIEARMPPGRPPSVNTEAGDRRGFRSRSGAIMRKKTNRKSIPDPTELHGVHSWSSTDLADNDSGFHFTPMSTMRDEGDADDASIPLQAMLASSPWAEPEPIRQEMKDAMKARSYLLVQAANRNELRRMKAFRNKQVRALQILHEGERNKMLSVFEQQKDLIDAKYRQALMHLLEDRQVIAELDLLAALDERLKREQGKLRHMEAYCSPLSGRDVTPQNLAMLDAQRALVEQLQSDQFRQDTSNHLREKQETDVARLPKQQELELDELDGKKQKAVAAREDVEMQETRVLNAVVRRRRDASVARCNLRLEVWRRKFEGEALRPLPGPLPYLSSEDVFDAFWMVDIPLKSALDQILPEERHVLDIKA